MFGGNNGNKDQATELLGVMAGIVMFVGTIFVMTYKGAAKVTRWGMAKHRESKERERISKL